VSESSRIQGVLVAGILGLAAIRMLTRTYYLVCIAVTFRIHHRLQYPL
jgi:hypothetical protein